MQKYVKTEHPVTYHITSYVVSDSLGAVKKFYESEMAEAKWKYQSDNGDILYFSMARPCRQFDLLVDISMEQIDTEHTEVQISITEGERWIEDR